MNLADELRTVYFDWYGSMTRLQNQYPEQFFEIEDDWVNVYDTFDSIISKLGRIGWPPAVPWEDGQWAIKQPGEGVPRNGKDDKRGREKFKVKPHKERGLPLAPRQ